MENTSKCDILEILPSWLISLLNPSGIGVNDNFIHFNFVSCFYVWNLEEEFS